MPPKRLRDDDTTAEELQRTVEAFSRTRSAVDEAVSEFLCPITQSLPIDPVTAEDGKVYERSAIEEWLKTHERSPLTNEAIGARLLPALQVKNMISTMVKSGALTGEKAAAWKERLAEEEEVAETRRKAEAGDDVAMLRLGNWHMVGSKGLLKDEAKAFEWFSKSHEAGCATGTNMLGRCYLLGWGVEPCNLTAMSFTTEAASRGSQLGCFNLGRLFAGDVPIDGWTKNVRIARRWYSEVATASVKDASDGIIEKAAAWLRTHEAR